MVNKRNLLIFFSVLAFSIIFFSNYLNNDKNSSKQIEQITNEAEKEIYSSNVIENVSYKANDNRGNEYAINALTGEIDIKDNDIIFLTDVTAVIKLESSEYIKITSKFGKYNIKNNDTIFSKNVLIKYLDSRISSNYMEFSINKSLMTITNNVIYSNNDNLLKADVVEFNNDKKKINIFMYDGSEKVKIISKN